MIIGDDERVARLFRDRLDATSPGRELLCRVKVVIAFVLRKFWVVAEPGVVAAAVQADVANRRSGFFRRLKRAADHGLIDVAECRVMLTEQREEFGIVPGGVAHLYRERVIGEALQNGTKVCGSFRGAVKRERELQQYCAELAGLVQDIEAGSDGAFVFRSGAWVVREFLPQFRGEHKARSGGNAIKPPLGVLRVQWLVERGIDLDGGEELRQVRGFVKAFRPRRRVHVTGPIRIRPSCWPNTNVRQG